MRGVWAGQRFLVWTLGSQLTPPSQQPKTLPHCQFLPNHWASGLCRWENGSSAAEINSPEVTHKVLSSFHTFYGILQASGLEIFFLIKNKTNQRSFHMESSNDLLLPRKSMCLEKEEKKSFKFWQRLNGTC